MATPRSATERLDAASIAALAAKKVGHPVAADRLVTAAPGPAQASCGSLKASKVPAGVLGVLGVTAGSSGQLCAAAAQPRQPSASVMGPGVGVKGGARPEIVQNSPTTFVSPDWVQAQPSTAPPAGFAAASAYDPVRHVTVLFGGCTPAGCSSSDTWTFDGSTWTVHHLSVAPQPRYTATMVFDSALGVMILFGGESPAGLALPDSWAWTGSTWVQLFPPVSPPARYGASMAYAGARSEVVLFGGFDASGKLMADTWVFTAAGWAQVFPAVSPPAVAAGASLAFDPATGVDVLVDAARETWLFDGSNWALAKPAGSPPQRFYAGMVYDPDLAALVLFGGLTLFGSSAVLNDTWAWTGSTWLSAGAIGAPSGRMAPAMVYDSDHHEVVQFGGLGVTAQGAATYLGDTWSYNSAVPAVTVTADRPPASPFQRGAAVTYSAVVANPGLTAMTAVSFTDVFPAGLSPAGTTVTVEGGGYAGACPAPLACTVTASAVGVAGLSIPAGTAVRIGYRAVAVGADGGCGQFSDMALAADAFGVSPPASASVAVCGSGLGAQPWMSFVSRPLGPQSTANVNVADGNLVVRATDTTAVQGHGHLGYALQRSYNSGDAAVGPLGVGWTMGLAGVGEAGGAGRLNLGTVALSVPGVELPGQPVSVTLVQGDGAREVFSSKGTSLVLSTASLAGTNLANLLPNVLKLVTGTSICVDQSFQAPPGVHMALYRYLQVSVTGAGACAQGAGLTGAVDLGFAAEATNGLRYEFAATGELLDVLDRNGTELRYLYTLPPVAGVQLGNLTGVYEPQSCPGLAPLAGPPPPGCRGITFAYPSATRVQVTDPAGRTTGYVLDTAGPGHLVEVDNPDGTTVKYSYGSCGGGADQLCSAGDPRGSTTNFTYQNPVPAGFAAYGTPPVATVADRRASVTTFTYGSVAGLPDTTVDQGGHRLFYLYIDSSGRVGALAEGTTAGVYSRVRYDFWDGGPFMGATGYCRAPDPAVDNNDCLTDRAALNAAQGNPAVTTPDEETVFAYSDEGKVLNAQQLLAAGTAGIPAPAAPQGTTYGYHVQYFEANGVLARQVNCADATPVGGGAVSQSATGCQAHPDATTLYAIVDQTAVVPPRGNQPGVDYHAYQTTYKPDDNTAGANPNTYQPGVAYCATAVAANTGDLCEVDTPSPTGTGMAATKYAYDAYGQKTQMTTPNGGSYSYTYYPDPAANGGVIPTDLSGHTQASGWLRGVTDPAGSFVAYGYDAAGNTARAWDRDGTGAAGQPLGAYPGTLATPTSCGYTETLHQGGGASGTPHPCASATAPAALANPWRYLRSSRDPLGNLTTLVVDGDGNQTAITAPRGNTAGNTGNYTTTQTFDANNNRLTLTLPVGSSDGTTPGKTTWTYDPFNNPATTLDARNHITAYSYDPVNRLTATRWTRGANLAATARPATCPPVTNDAVFPAGADVCATTVAYDGVDNIVATQDGDAQTTTFGYDAVHRQVTTVAPGYLNGVAATVGLRTDTVYDADGHPTDTCPPREFDPAQGASAAAANPGGATCTASGIYSTHNTYNPAGKRTATTTYRSGGVAKAANQADTTTYGYDADGNTVATTNPDGTAAGAAPNNYTVFAGYNLLDRKTCQSTPRQAGTSGAGSCAPAALAATVTYNTTTWNYDPSGDTINETMPPGADGTARVSAWSYDADHRIVDTVTGAAKPGGGTFGAGDDATKAGPPDANGATNVRTRVAYDPDGHIAARYNPRAFTAGATAAWYTETVVYDADGRPVTDSVPRYDTAADPTVGPSPTQANQCPTGAAGYPATTGVCVTTASYDATGNVARLTLPTATDPAAAHAANRYLAYTWTDDNLPAARNAPDPANDGARLDGQNGRPYATTYRYDADKKPVATTDAPGDTTTTTYTPDEQVHSVAAQGYTDTAGHTVTPTTTYGYDANGNKTAVTDGQANTTKVVYSADNLVADHIDGAGDDTRYSYDPTGNPTTVASPSAVAKDATNPTGAATTNSYTLDNLLAATTKPDTTAGTPAAVTAWRQTVYGYDPAGRKTGQQTTPTPTAAPIPALGACASAATECFAYYPDDRTAGQQGRGGADTITASYDPAGNTTATTDTATGPAGYTNTVTATYYLDNLTRSVDDATQTTSYSYDAARQTAARAQTGDGPLGVAHNSRYTYNDAGLPAAAASDLTSTTSNPRAPGAWTFGYDHAGRHVGQSDPNGEIATMAYNPDSTLAGKTVSAASTTLAGWTYQYNNDQQITTQTVTEGGSSALTNCTPAQPTGPCAGPYRYTYDRANRLASFSDAGGPRTISYDRDSNRTNYGVAADTYTPQPGQPKTLKLSYNADDGINQTISGPATQTFTYSPTGDLATDGCNTYTQDGFDRTTQVANSGRTGCGTASTVAYSYDGLDRQRSHTDSLLNLPPVTTNIGYDGLNRTVTSENPLGATILATNYALSPAGHPLAVSAGLTTSTAQELVSDGTRTVALTTTNTAPNSVPPIDCTARFDPYGTPEYAQPSDAQHVCNTGNTPNDVFYNGARHDATSGTYQYGPRTYDPTKAAFLTPDTYRAGPAQANLSIGVDPLTRNTYNYVNGDPVNLTDLNGHGFCLAGHNPNGSCRGASQARQAAATIGGSIAGAIAFAGADIACGGPEDLPCDPVAVAAGIDAGGAAGDAIASQLEPSSDTPTTPPTPPTSTTPETQTQPGEPASGGPTQPPPIPAEPPANVTPEQAPSSSNSPANPTSPTNRPGSNANVQAEATVRSQAAQAEMVKGQAAGVANTTAANSGTIAAETAPSVSELGQQAGSRASELQGLLPEGSQGRVTMGVGVGEDASGGLRTVIGTSEPGGYLRPGVRGAIQPGEEIAPGLGHAEQDILAYMEANGIDPITVGAGRPICPMCAQAIDQAGAWPASPLRVP